MKHVKLSVFIPLLILVGLSPVPSSANQLPIPFEKLAKDCGPSVHVETLKALVSVESGGNPFAIGVVNRNLNRQPKSIEEAVATARRLESEGFNFSMGLTQVNRYNLAKHGESYASIFDPCRNIRTGAAILTDCYTRATTKDMGEQAALRAALSCYYSGNFIRGFKPDSPGQPSYVQKVVNAALKGSTPLVPKIQPVTSAPEAIEINKGTSSGPTPKTVVEPMPWVIFGQSEGSTPLKQDSGARNNPVQVKPIGSPSNSDPNFVRILE